MVSRACRHLVELRQLRRHRLIPRLGVLLVADPFARGRVHARVRKAFGIEAAAAGGGLTGRRTEPSGRCEANVHPKHGDQPGYLLARTKEATCHYGKRRKKDQLNRSKLRAPNINVWQRKWKRRAPNLISEPVNFGRSNQRSPS